jgi:UDP-glucose 4-epimerase
MKSKNILVTGGAGFIGSHLVKRLVNLNVNVTVTVKYKSIIDCPRLVSVWDKIDIIEADIKNLDSVLFLKRYKNKFDIIFHLAAYNHVGDSFVHINESLKTNILGTSNLLEFGPNYDRFIYTATSEVYGLQKTVPFTEEDLPFPISPYAIGKYGGELYANLKKHQNNDEIICLRPFNTFGPYQSERAIIPELIIKCLKGEEVKTTDGLQTREFNFVDNIVDGFILAAKMSEIPKSSINIGAGEEIVIKDLIKKIHKLTNSSSKLSIGALPTRPTEIWRMRAENTKAKSMLGWKASVPFKEGLIQTIKWFKNFIDLYFNDDGLRRL